ncbi:uncharacterized protein [Ptychodera flava]|uniref:uncharacterized protein n=1 Tax=Ptychodera flava TaxID=63121 RepID=UPI00396A42A6
MVHDNMQVKVVALLTHLLAKTIIDKAWKKILLDPGVRSYAANQGVQWHFIVELAPWMGGFYERLVGVVKKCLRKAIGKVCFTYDQLQTVLAEVEAVVNSRPLVYVGDDINSSITLTPSHFLTLNPSTGIPGTETEDVDPEYLPRMSTSAKLLQTWKKGQSHLNRFWQIWRDDYLLTLRERFQTRHKGPRNQVPYKPSPGDVVLCKENLPRGAWNLGKIQNVIKSSDGEIRAVKVLFPSKKTITQPLKLLYPIECPKCLELRIRRTKYNNQRKLNRIN